MNKKILLIDDEELIIKSLTKLLKAKGFEVAIAKCMQDALGAVQEKEYNLFISDIRMPEANGVEIINKLYEYLDQKDILRPPIIFITGYADKKYEKVANQLNPAAYIYKPFDIHDLLQNIEKVFA